MYIIADYSNPILFLRQLNIPFTAMASKLHMLDESLRKFEMDDLGCQMLLSCEAAQLETMDHPVYGNLTSKMHKLLR